MGGPRVLVAAVVLVVLAVHGVAAETDWSPVQLAMQNGVTNLAYPGATAIVMNKDGILFSGAVGNFTFGKPAPMSGGNPPMQLDTKFDMASCSKVVSATTAAAHLYQRGLLDVDMLVSDPVLFGPAYAVGGKEAVRVRNLLLHNAGFPADPIPNYWAPDFECPETAKPEPAENFSCATQIAQAVMDQPLVRPVNTKYVYSDLSFITLMYVVGKVAHDHALVTPADLLPQCSGLSGMAALPCYYEAFARTHMFAPLKMASTGFLPPRAVWGDCAPCENDTHYLRRVIQGQVSDGNAYALGGISGHAGLFSTAPDVAKLMHKWHFATDDDAFLNATTVQLWTRMYNASQSSRAFGWNTNSKTVYDYGWWNACGNLSASTYMHLGYTGTQICADPERGIVTILLTNRVYPSDTNGSAGRVRTARIAFNNAVVKVLG